ncbi:MAG: hypothetical protein HQL53_14125 [Magnetococcales bacterium]|nr:hypothetical protein [Magnetococcales bacterium]
MTGAPKHPKSPLGRIQGSTINAEATKIYGWNRHKILVVAQDDDRLSWEEQEVIRQVGEKLYGRPARQGVGHA